MPVPVLGRKPWYTSNGIRGGAVAILAGFVGLWTGDVEQTVSILTDVATVIGGAMAIYGRITATQKIRI
jgi:hypothetical protein